MCGEKTGFAYSEDIQLPALEQAAAAARTISRSGGHQIVHANQRSVGHALYLPVIHYSH